jgi:inosine-uridine nucleoside N-ribohydrolase
MCAKQVLLIVAIVAGTSACLAAGEKAARPRTRAVPVIFDTDIGGDIDDTWALTLLLKSPQFDVKLVTTSAGMAEYRAKIIAKLLTVAGRTDIPVGVGEGGRKGVGGQQPWVKDYKLSDYPGKVYQDGAGAVIDVINRSPQPVTVISVGPLHTMAEVLKRDPRIPTKASFAGMFGSVRKGYGGGSKIAAECNVVGNAPAAQRVLSAPWQHLCITPVDTCGLVNLSGQRFQALKLSNDPSTKAMLENYRIWAGKKSIDELQASSTLFDTVAVYLANPGDKSLIRFETLPIIVTNDGFTRIDPKGKMMLVATSWKDLDGFRDLLVKTLTGP